MKTLFAPFRGLTARNSIRRQLILGNILFLAVLLGALGVIIRYTVATSMMASIDRELEQRTRPAGPHPDGPPPPREDNGPQREGGGPPRDALFRHGDRGPDGPRFDRFPRQPIAHSAQEGIIFRPRLFDLNGRDRFDPAGTLWDADAFDTVKQGKPLTSITEVEGEPVRVLSKPIFQEGRVVGVIQAPYPLTEVYRALAVLNGVLLTLIPVALLGAGLGGASLTDRVLRRVRRMTHTAGHISALDFSERLPVSGNDEFSELADTFNGMLNRLETAYRQQERLVAQQRQFTADASHELKTPLTIIKGNTSMALSGAASLEACRESLQDIDRAANTMSRLVQDLLLLARADEGQLHREPVVLPIREILERAAAGSRRPGLAPITLEADPTLSVPGNQDELLRLFSNLLENAVRYTPETGEITISAQKAGRNIVVTVTDTGAGIAPEHLPYLTERFYRVSESRSRPDGGSGLGLAICKSVVEAHGGTLDFASTVGVGTTVRVVLPAENAETV